MGNTSCLFLANGLFLFIRSKTFSNSLQPKKFSVYIGLALVLYFMGSKIETASFALQFVLQNSLLLFYLAFIFF